MAMGNDFRTILDSTYEKIPESPATGDGSTRRELSRRAFIFGSAAAVSACAFWGLRRGTVAAARPLARDEGPATVTVVKFSEAGEKEETVTVPRVIRTDAEWRKMLSQEAYWVTRHADTEQAFSGAYWNLEEHGIFRCIGCDLALFRSETKFDSGTGWPSFWQPIAQENVVDSVDGSLLEVRTAVSCRLCDGHLGHVFNDGPAPTGLRYCMNSVSMRFVKV
jgi:peptide-methionine (R)-S-oxide reductase